MTKMRYIIAFFLVLLLSCAPVSSMEVDLSWGLPQSVGIIDGYRVYWGTESGVYTDSCDVGNVFNTTLFGLPDDIYLYIITRTYNAVGESDNSNEVKIGKATILPSAPGNLIILEIR